MLGRHVHSILLPGLGSVRSVRAKINLGKGRPIAPSPESCLRLLLRYVRGYHDYPCACGRRPSAWAQRVAEP
jgi:hypothetical protein